MPIASIYVEKRTKHVLQESGYLENPFAVTRWGIWREEKYGYSPAWMALPEARQVNLLQEMMDALVDVQVYPRILAPDGTRDEIDLTPGGVTSFDRFNPNAVPREWGQGGRYDIGVDRVNHRQEAINKAFHVDLFQLFANLDQKNMTAREVHERASEKLFMFNPTFSRMESELFKPLLTRVFALLLRQGRFPQPPQGRLVPTQGGFALPDPEMELNSRLARSIKQSQNGAVLQVEDVFLPITELQPELWDNLNVDAAFRDVFTNAGGPQEWLRDPREIEALRQARQQQQEQAMQMEQAETMAKAAKHASGADAGKIQELMG